ncbi:hypothetical protein INT48_001320 [Thamnidium elegans]|uniref:Tyr recombinase domain-containing protein n=1 Tax=Thamnidium elegans TaxID=101142 RepID=A0A8H7SP89_9FUNG|nr:hypothetical protein INT48_001320 [Thamnidium elegans]
MPALESNTQYTAEVTTGSVEGMRHDNTKSGQRNLVPTPTAINSLPRSDTYSTRGSSRITRSIAVAFGQKPTLETDSVAFNPLDINKQRRVDLPSTLNDESTAIIFNPSQLKLQQKRYDGPRQRFLNWGLQHNRKVLEFVTAIDLINYLAYGHVHHKWVYSIILQYKQGILQLYTAEQHSQITSDPSYIKFVSALKNEAIISFDFPVINLQPAIDFILALGNNQQMPLLQLTQKLCFLLGITGFLRPSDIERINDSKTSVSDGTLRLVILAPKKKRSGHPIEKVVIVSEHSNQLLCPVTCYQSYQERFSSLSPLTRQHPRLSQLSYVPLVRNTTDHNKFIGSERISEHIKSILNLATTTATPSSLRTKAIKARAVGSTRAILAGAKLEDVLTHGSWASSSIFDTYYRLNRASATNFTDLIL